MHVGDAAPYVAGAYIVVFVALVAYLWLIASKLGRLEERLDRLRDDARPAGELAAREEDEAA
jgi:CcmD family protein